MEKTAVKNKKIFFEFMPVILIAVVFLVILLLVVFSAVSYQRAVDIQDENNNTRAVLSYVTTAVKSGNVNKSELTERDGIPMFVIEDGTTGFEQQIYFYEGKVLESYEKAGSSPKPEKAVTVGEAERFEMRWASEGLLEIDSDIGTSYVHVRNAD